MVPVIINCLNAALICSILNEENNDDNDVLYLPLKQFNKELHEKKKFKKRKLKIKNKRN